MPPAAAVAATLAALGGCATTAELREHHSQRQLALAVAEGVVERPTRGRHVLAVVGEHRRLAYARTGTLSQLSAALDHGWKVKDVPQLAQVTFPRTRRLRKGQREGLVPHWEDLSAEERAAGVTAPVRTVLDCARTLPFDAALAVADSALRSGRVRPGSLRRAAEQLQGPGCVPAREVLRWADGRAANPLESVLRAHAIAEGFALTPQLQVAETGMFAVVDLGDPDLRLILEAEGYETHGTRKGLRRDCRRHTEFTVFGWDSMRYAYEDVMFDGPWVRWTLRAWRDVRLGRVPEAPPQSQSPAA